MSGKNVYRPLPDSLTIGSSNIDGLGLYAVKDIKKDTILGVSHIKMNSEWIRTPLGGFYNHFEKPNAKKVHHKNVFKEWYELVVTKDVRAGTEIVVSYTFYKPT